ncbi:MAG: hypothetical protein HWN65_17640 [Candidatus Helarchaeota archaeon]|nr:hypothetical protein [Candidatus Helarchaeota archaeon]
MAKSKKKFDKNSKTEEEEIPSKVLKKAEERKGDFDEITKELKSTFSLPKYGLKNRTMNVMARIDAKTSKIIDALVALELAPSRSSAAAFLITDAIRKDKDKYEKILESYETIKQAKKRAQYSFYKSLQEELESENERTENED